MIYQSVPNYLLTDRLLFVRNYEHMLETCVPYVAVYGTLFMKLTNIITYMAIIQFSTV